VCQQNNTQTAYDNQIHFGYFKNDFDFKKMPYFIWQNNADFFFMMARQLIEAEDPSSLKKY
jgi:hypothetical protein